MISGIPSESAILITVRAIYTLSLLGLLGGLFFIFWLVNHAIRHALWSFFSRYLTINIGLSWLTALLIWGLEGGYLGQGWSDVLSLSLWRELANTYWGRAWLVLMLSSSMGLIYLIVLRYQKVDSFYSKQGCILTLLALVQVGAFSIVGHAAEYSGVVGLIQKASALLHGVATSFWFGSLLPLWAVLGYAEKNAETRALTKSILYRYSYYGHGLVLMLIATGFLAVYLIVPYPYHFHLPYLQFLGLKLICVGCVVGVALYNRYYLLSYLPAIWALVRLRQFVLVEWLLLAMILSLVSYFSTLMP